MLRWYNGHPHNNFYKRYPYLSIMRILLLSALLLVAHVSAAQSPQKFTYQSVIRDASENLVQNSNVGIQITIRQNSSSGTIVYQEQHAATTNQNGLATLEIGTGTVLNGSSIHV